MSKNAFISVFDKQNLKEFAINLKKFGYNIIATSSTYNYLINAGIEAKNIENITGFAPILEGKVKTLHPKVHASILADRKNLEDVETLKKLNIEPFDLVVVNLYPFKTIAKKSDDIDELIKNIDIGGVSLIRAASKNLKNVTIISDIDDYDLIINELKNYDYISDKTREKLSIKGFFKTCSYDSNIVEKLSELFGVDKYFSLNLIKNTDLRYGENPHQKACLYHIDNEADFNVLSGKELSYNNFLDMTYALNIVSEFYDVNCCSIVKHNIPCGVALGVNIEDAYDKALDCDPISAFGGIVAFSKTVDINVAKKLVSIFFEVIIAPDFEENALEILKTKKNLRIVKINTPLVKYARILKQEIKITPFGALVQSIDNGILGKDNFKVVTKEKPDSNTIEDLVFAWKIVKHVKSNAIVVAKDFKTLGISGGNTSRVESTQIATEKSSCDNLKDAVIASDGFFPALDNIHIVAQNRIKAIIQPGGSIKDNDVINECNKYNIIMVMTSMRHFKH